MQSVCPHKIEMADRQKVDLPEGTVPLSVFYKDDGWVLFAKQPAETMETKLVSYEISCFGTGRTFEVDPGPYLNTFNSKADDGSMRIFHAFAKIAE